MPFFSSRMSLGCPLLLMLLTVSNWPTANAGPPSQDWVGNWAFSLPDGYPAWLRIAHVAPNRKPDGGPSEKSNTRNRDPDNPIELLWSVGSARSVTKFEWVDETLRLYRRLSWRPAGGSSVRKIDQPLVARIDGDEMRLTFRQYDPAQREQSARFVTIIGKRMPPLPSKPNLDNVRFGEPILLFNGQDLSGWQLSSSEKRNGWRAANGVLINETPKRDFGAYGDYGNLITEQSFIDFRLSLEYNVPKGGNSGVYLRGMYEVQVVDRDSSMQGIQGPGAIFGRIRPSHNAGRPGGQWNRLEVTLVDRHVTVVLNGDRVIDNQPLLGCTGGGIGSDDTRPGPLLLQGDHTNVRYRNLKLRPRLTE